MLLYSKREVFIVIFYIITTTIINVFLGLSVTKYFIFFTRVNQRFPCGIIKKKMYLLQTLLNFNF